MEPSRKSCDKVFLKGLPSSRKVEGRASTSGKRPIRGSLTKRGPSDRLGKPRKRTGPLHCVSNSKQFLNDITLPYSGSMKNIKSVGRNYLSQQRGLKEKNKELVMAVEEFKDTTKNLRNFNDELQCENFRLLERVNILEKRLAERKDMGLSAVTWNSFNLIKEAVKKVTLATDVLVNEINSTRGRPCASNSGEPRNFASGESPTGLNCEHHFPSTCPAEGKETSTGLVSCLSVPFEIFQDKQQMESSKEEQGNSGYDAAISEKTNKVTIKTEASDRESTWPTDTTSLPVASRKEKGSRLNISSRCTVEDQIRRTLRHRAVTYKEPSRKAKLRRGDPFTDPSFYSSPRLKGKRFKRQSVKKKDSLRDISNAIIEPSEETAE